MPQPYDYSLNVPNPAEALTRGLQTGVQLGEVQAQSQLRNQQAQALQAQAQRRQQFQQALGGLGANPSAKQISGLLVQFPEMNDLLKESYDRLNKEEQVERVSQASQVYSATLAGDNDLAVKQLNEYAAAYRNAGREADAKALEDSAKLFETNPEAAEISVASWLSVAQGADKFAENFAKQQADRLARAKEGAELTIKEKQAEQEAVKSKFAEQLAQSQLNLNEAQVRNLAMEPEFKRANLELLTLQAQYARETNALKREELAGKIEDRTLAREEKARLRVEGARAGAASIDNTINNIDRLLKSPGLNDVVGSLEGKPGYPNTLAALVGATNFTGLFTSSADERADAISALDSIQSQIFISTLQQLKASGPSGLGSLTEKEGDRLIAGLQSLSRQQSEGKFRENVTEVKRLLLKSRDGLEKSYGQPRTTPDTPAAASDPDSDEVNASVAAANSAAANNGTARY